MNTDLKQGTSQVKFTFSTCNQNHYLMVNTVSEHNQGSKFPIKMQSAKQIISM